MVEEEPQHQYQEDRLEASFQEQPYQGEEVPALPLEEAAFPVGALLEVNSEALEGWLDLGNRLGGGVLLVGAVWRRWPYLRSFQR